MSDLIVLNNRSYPVIDFGGMWVEDMFLLKGENSFRDKDLGALPSNAIAGEVLKLEEKRWTDPVKPIVLDKRTAEMLVKDVHDRMMDVGVDDFPLPRIEVVSSKEFIPRLNALEEEANRVSIPLPLTKSPPTSAFMPYNNVLVCPEVFHIRRVAKPGALEGLTGEEALAVETHPWDEAFLESVFINGLASASFRQARGESGKGYADALKNLDAIESAKVRFWCRVFAQVVMERISSQDKTIGLFSVSGKIRSFYSDRNQRAAYSAFRAVGDKLGLNRIVQADFGMAHNGGPMFLEIFDSHPSYEKKKSKLIEGSREPLRYESLN